MCVVESVRECERVENVLFTVAKFVMFVLGLARRAYSVRCEGGWGLGGPTPALTRVGVGAGLGWAGVGGGSSGVGDV